MSRRVRDEHQTVPTVERSTGDTETVLVHARLRAERERDEAVRERDEARAEVERLRAGLAESHMAHAQSLADLDMVTSERDRAIKEHGEARAEVERLKAERRELCERVALAAMLAERREHDTQSTLSVPLPTRKDASAIVDDVLGSTK